MKLFAIRFSSYSCTKQLLIHGQNSIWVCYRVNEIMSGKSLATFLCEEFCDGDPDDHQESDDDGNSDSQGCDKISQQTADRLYREAGQEVDDLSEPMSVLPGPMMMTTNDEQLIQQAKVDLQIHHSLDQFQIQSLLGKQPKMCLI